MSRAGGEDRVPAAAVAHDVVHLPNLRAVLLHSLPNLVEATVVPTGVIYAGLAAGHIDVGLVGALVWALGMLAWRASTGRRVSGLLGLAALGLTIRTGIALGTGSTFWYFLQPVVVTVVVGAAFLASACTRRPLVGRLALDFCPLQAGIAERHGVRRLFSRLTVFWGLVNVANGLTTLWLLLTLPTGTFLAVKSLTALALTWSAIGVTVVWALAAGRREGLRRATTAPAAAGTPPVPRAPLLARLTCWGERSGA